MTDRTTDQPTDEGQTRQTVNGCYINFKYPHYIYLFVSEIGSQEQHWQRFIFTLAVMNISYRFFVVQISNIPCPVDANKLLQTIGHEFWNTL